MIHFEERCRFESPRITAASGLVLLRDQFYFVADDELTLGILPDTAGARVKTLPLWKGSLPEDPKERKLRKPDLESLVAIPGSGALLCLPSGSTPNRTRGAWVSPDHEVRELSFSASFARLRSQITDLNIEGAVVRGEEILLFQRGNGLAGLNAVLILPLREWLEDRPSTPMVIPVDLGTLGGVRLGFTDAWIDQGVLWFLAAAEGSGSTYDDGKFTGAIVGTLDPRFRPASAFRLDVPFKPEGLVVRQGEIHLVTDADDRSIPSRLYSGKIPGFPYQVV